MNTPNAFTLFHLLVHMDASPRAAVRLSLAHKLAARCGPGCSIEAAYCTSPSFADMPLAYAEGAAGALGFLQQLYEQRYNEARGIFDRAQAASTQPMQWLEARGTPVVAAITARALYADLLFLGQHKPDEMGTLSTPAHLVETVLIDSGKPAIVLPHIGDFDNIGSEVLLAWKPTREAARAVAAALPLLQRARRVDLAFEPGPDADPDADGSHLESYLHAHGVTAPLRRHALRRGEPSGEQLLSLAADIGADLLVMGCYGHSRAREIVLGGVTRTVLQSMTLPVLMAH